MTMILTALAIFLTSLISGVLGMGGGILLAGALAAFLPLSVALILHAITQLSANSFRALLHFRSIQWRAVMFYTLGLFLTAVIFLFWQITLNKPVFYFALGTIALLSHFAPKGMSLNIVKPWHAVWAGTSVTALHLFVGVAGPLLDVFFQRTSLTRFQIMATKAATQTIGHLVRICFYVTVYKQQWSAVHLTTATLLAIVGLTVIASYLGSRLLQRVNEQQFARYSRLLLQGLGFLFITKGFLGLVLTTS